MTVSDDLNSVREIVMVFAPLAHRVEGLAALDAIEAAWKDAAKREGDYHSAAGEAEQEVERLRAELAAADEAVASALTSLGTGPLKDGYAHAVLSERAARGDETR